MLNALITQLVAQMVSLNILTWRSDWLKGWAIRYIQASFQYDFSLGSTEFLCLILYHRIFILSVFHVQLRILVDILFIVRIPYRSQPLEYPACSCFRKRLRIEIIIILVMPGWFPFDSYIRWFERRLIAICFRIMNWATIC